MIRNVIRILWVGMHEMDWGCVGGKTKACSDACTECKGEDFKLNGGNRKQLLWRHGGVPWGCPGRREHRFIGFIMQCLCAALVLLHHSSESPAAVRCDKGTAAVICCWTKCAFHYQGGQKRAIETFLTFLSVRGDCSGLEKNHSSHLLPCLRPRALVAPG